MVGQPLINIYHWFTSWVFVLVNGYPARYLTLIGVTGTDGKTTSSHLIYEILKAANFKVGLISTIGAFMGDKEMDTGLHVTTADARLLQPLLARMLKKGITHVVLEVTSHGLDQNRLIGCNFKIGVITNITHEHLDYHKTFEKYRETKAKLILNAQYAILNKDDPSTPWLKSQISNLKSQTIIQFSKTQIPIKNQALVGEYSRYNIGAAEEVAKILGIRYSVVGQVIKNFRGVPGRMEEIKLGQPFRAVVDFAHTPNALEQVLKELKTQKPKNSKLILVFGCAGERDRAKRSLMGEIARRLADVVIVTAEDPRTEQLADIYQQITAGKSGFIREDDRQRAINMGVSLAKPGDIVMATGKGHEESMCFGKTEVPWSDREAIQSALRTQGQSGNES